MRAADDRARAKSGYDRVLLRDGMPSFSEAEIRRRQAALRTVMEEHHVAAAILYGAGRFNADVQYLCNWPGGREAYLLLPLDRRPILLVQLYNHVPLAERLSLEVDTRWGGPDSAATAVSYLRELGSDHSRIGLIGALPFSQYDRLRAALPACEFVDLSKAYRDMRLIRSEEELQFFRVAADLTDHSLETLEQQLRPGLREYELAAILEEIYLRAGGSAGIHFMTSTSMHDPKAFVPHQYHSTRVLQRGDILITEISGSFWGHASQIHRTFCLGEPTPEYVRLHEVAVEAYEAIESVLRDGATAEQVLDAAEVIHRSGYTIFDDLLHGVHQSPPILRTRSTDHGYPRGFVFRENMVVTIQPQPISPDRRIGLQFGETVRITQRGVERLHGYSRRMIVLS